MIGFDYEYTTSSDIINNIKLLTEYSIQEYIILGVSIIILISLIYYIIPLLNISYTFMLKGKEKQKKKKLIRQIVMQKDINDEIEKELN
ncbi:MAG: hypothetical protein QM490_04655, partial [Candidatus Gracilibacteria bacterium]